MVITHWVAVMGNTLKLTTRHPIQVFFVGIGDADLEIKRILAEATRSDFQGTTDKSLASVLATFGQYFWCRIRQWRKQRCCR